MARSDPQRPLGVAAQRSARALGPGVGRVPQAAAGARLRRAAQGIDKHREASRSMEHGPEI